LPRGGYNADTLPPYLALATTSGLNLGLTWLPVARLTLLTKKSLISQKTTATRSACDSFARAHVGGDVVPVAVQGVCSCTVYAGDNAEFVVQFRLASLQLSMKIAKLARSIYGQFAPQVTVLGQIGEVTENKEALYISVISRLRGISYLDLILAYNSLVPENSPTFSL
jgi:hypothetical protein